MKAIIATLLLTISLSAETLRGKVTSIADGDTLTVTDASSAQHKIRLNGIDAPELSQDFGEASKKNIAALTLGKDVVVVWSKVDRYGRIVGTVIQGALDIGLIQLRDGFAWYFRQYESDVPLVERVIYDAAEQVARTQLRGLWSQPNARPPWDVRHPEQSTLPAPLTQSSVAPTTAPPVVPQRSETVPYREPSRAYYRGPRGGCYYMSGKRKVYVDRSLCN